MDKVYKLVRCSKWYTFIETVASDKLLRKNVNPVYNKVIKNVSIVCFSTPRSNYQSLNPLKIYISRIDKEEHHIKSQVITRTIKSFDDCYQEVEIPSMRRKESGFLPLSLEWKEGLKRRSEEGMRWGRVHGTPSLLSTIHSPERLELGQNWWLRISW